MFTSRCDRQTPPSAASISCRHLIQHTFKRLVGRFNERAISSTNQNSPKEHVAVKFRYPELWATRTTLHLTQNTHFLFSPTLYPRLSLNY
ncbi:unnamed protein product [Protopolystoma xenopodis]|uniref:Uncharacterized protein n=1 Tax=Protopolystoma xenopodis TaxID=117903 RepID=A0A448XIS5_9PLAT|nr:unnamed protein product [Protopolystoma xenopodis]